MNSLLKHFFWRGGLWWMISGRVKLYQVPLFKHLLDLPGHPGFLVGENPDAFFHSSSVVQVLILHCTLPVNNSRSVYSEMPQLVLFQQPCSCRNGIIRASCHSSVYVGIISNMQSHWVKCGSCLALQPSLMLQSTLSSVLNPLVSHFTC